MTHVLYWRSLAFGVAYKRSESEIPVPGDIKAISVCKTSYLPGKFFWVVQK